MAFLPRIKFLIKTLHVCNREEQKTGMQQGRTENGYATGKNIKCSSPDTIESEIYSMKHLNKKHVLQNVKDDFDFRSKTANYINQVIPLEKDLVKKI